MRSWADSPAPPRVLPPLPAARTGLAGFSWRRFSGFDRDLVFQDFYLDSGWGFAPAVHRKRAEALGVRERRLAVFVGVARLVITIPGAQSLKDRRRVVKSLKDRIRAKLPVSIAEVGDLERYQVATLGVAIVSNDSARCSEVLEAAARMARGARDAVLADVATETITLGAGGRGVRGGIEQALGPLGNAKERSWNDEDGDE